MKLIIDQGNTFIKIGIFDENELIFSEAKTIIDKLWLDKMIAKYHIDQSILSTVKNNQETLQQNLLEALPNIIFFDETVKLPFNNLYKTPLTIGKDRLAAVAGAIAIMPSVPLLVFDAGTALTIESINEHGEFVGGNISPGLHLRYKSLNEFTSRLPLLEKADQDFMFGDTTNKAIIAGVQNSIVFEIDEYINRYKLQHPLAKAIITGGDAAFFAGKLKNHLFAEVNLVLIGLNRILNYNTMSFR